MTQRIEISYKTILFTIFTLLALYFLFLIRDVIFLVVVAFIIASGLRPLVEKLEKIKVPRIAAILLVYLLVIFIIILCISFIIPPLVSESVKLGKELGSLIYSFSPYIDVSPQEITNKITPLTGDIFRVTLDLFSNVFNIFTLFVFSFYLLLASRNMRGFLQNLFGEKIKDKVVKIILTMEERMGAWVRGQLTLALVIGAVSYIGLTFLQVRPVLPLAIFAGILEMVPIVGPIISAIPAVLVAFGTSSWLGISTIIFYFVVQQLENHLVVPLVMRRAVGVPPLVSLLALLIGGKLAGIMGVILSIPIFLCFQVLVQEFILKRNENNTTASQNTP